MTLSFLRKFLSGVFITSLHKLPNTVGKQRLRLWVKLAAAVGFINGVARATFGALSPIG
jgi:hypothetical protein